MSDAAMDALRERTGNVSDDSLLVSFLYELMRDHVPTGVVEKIVRSVEKEQKCPEALHFCNGHLAQYAQDAAARLLQPKEEETDFFHSE
jgi:hypothetical protein